MFRGKGVTFEVAIGIAVLAALLQASICVINAYEQNDKNCLGVKI